MEPKINSKDRGLWLGRLEVEHDNLRPQGIEVPSLAEAELKLIEGEYEYVRQREEFMARFQPIDGVETDLVDRMLAASWREGPWEVSASYTYAPARFDFPYTDCGFGSSHSWYGRVRVPSKT